jgi:lysophospholipase L1-like esterase
MISGYPHKSGGFFNIACTHIAEGLACPVESEIFSFGGFPATRAEKYLEPRVVGYAPNYVIIQFGSLDALCPVRRRSLSVRGASGAREGGRNYQGRPATSWSLFRWEFLSLWGYFRRLEPTTPLAAYLRVMERMIDSCIAAGITPIVLTPFIYGSRYSMRNGVRYANALRQLVANKRGALLVDCIEVLRAYSKRAVLQHDGFHLSQKGHAIVGLAIAQQMAAHLQRLGNAPPPASLASLTRAS